MTSNYKLVEMGLISCEVCMKEMPKTEATNPEIMDYVVFFCGLECYEQWISQDAMLIGGDEESAF